MKINIENIMDDIRAQIINDNCNEKMISFITEYERNIIQAIREKEGFIMCGFGMCGKMFLCDLKSYGINNIFCICDNNKKISGTKYHGTTIMLPEEAVKKYPDAVYIITVYDAYEVMKHQLQTLGIKEENIKLYKQQ